jgi:hypothetical protein
VQELAYSRNWIREKQFLLYAHRYATEFPRSRQLSCHMTAADSVSASQCSLLWHSWLLDLEMSLARAAMTVTVTVCAENDAYSDMTYGPPTVSFALLCGTTGSLTCKHAVLAAALNLGCQCLCVTCQHHQALHSSHQALHNRLCRSALPSTAGPPVGSRCDLLNHSQ